MVILENFTKRIVQAGYVDGYFIELFPLFKHLPSVFAPWKKEAYEWAPQFTRLFDGLYGEVKEKVVGFFTGYSQTDGWLTSCSLKVKPARVFLPPWLRSRPSTT